MLKDLEQTTKDDQGSRVARGMAGEENYLSGVKMSLEKGIDDLVLSLLVNDTDYPCKHVDALLETYSELSGIVLREESRSPFPVDPKRQNGPSSPSRPRCQSSITHLTVSTSCSSVSMCMVSPDLFVHNGESFFTPHGFGTLSSLQ
jgi:hypothetical protein